MSESLNTDNNLSLSFPKTGGLNLCNIFPYLQNLLVCTNSERLCRMRVCVVMLLFEDSWALRRLEMYSRKMQDKVILPFQVTVSLIVIFLDVCCVGLITSCLGSSAVWLYKIRKFSGLELV